MKLYQFNNWYQQAIVYWSNPDNTDCPDACVGKLNELKSAVDSYRSYIGDSYVWFKRCISAMLSMKVAKDHTHFSDPNVPDVSVNTLTFTSLLGAFIVDLPAIESLFSTYQSQQSCETECGSSSVDVTGTVSYTCLDTSVVDNLITTIQNLPQEDYQRILNFIESIEGTDRALYLMFKSPNVEIQVDNISMYDIAIECELDKVIEFYNWSIPGFNT